MAFELGKLVVERIEDITALDPATDELMFLMDEPTGGSLESAMETVWAEGKGGRRLYGLDRNKTARMSFTNGYLVTRALQAQVGGNITVLSDTITADVPVVEYIHPAEGKLTLAYTPVAGSLHFVYVALEDLTQSDTKYDSTQFTLSGQEITLPQEADATATYIVIYDRAADAGTVITNESDQFTSNAKVIATVLCHDVCDMNKKIMTKLVFPRAKIDGNFTLDISGDAVVQELAIDAMSDVCSTEKVYWTWYIVE